MTLELRAADWNGDQDALMKVRSAVFIDEQGVPAELELDEHDALASHWLALDEGQAIGTLRMLRDGHIGRVAVLAPWRQRGIGSLLMAAAVQAARERQLFEVYLYAQIEALKFYDRLGFRVTSEPFLDAGILHQTMRLQLAERRLLGSHGGDFAVESLAATAQDMIGQCSRSLRILSNILEPAVFDTESMAAVVSALARRSRYSEVRMLVMESKPLVERGHRLLTLQRRLSPAVAIRRIDAERTDLKESFLIGDDCGLLVQSLRDGDTRWGNFNNRPLAQDYIAQFDDIWQHAIDDPELRRLEI